MNEIKGNSVLSSLVVPEEMQNNWQEMLNFLADTLDIPSALIMRVHTHQIEVFTKSRNKENIYKRGETAQLNTGLYCETVISTQRELIVPNALEDPLWKNNPDIDLGMIAYCGLPLTWPNGEAFGTICMLDDDTNQFSGNARKLLEHFQGSIQSHLANIYDVSQEKSASKKIKQKNKALEAKYTSLIKSIPAVTYVAALDEVRTTLFASEQIESLLGFTSTEFTNNPEFWFKQLHPDDRVRVLQATNESYKSHLPFACEYRMFDNKGNVKWIRDEANVVVNVNDSPDCIQGLMYDITAHKLIERQERLRSHVLELLTSDEELLVILNAILKCVEEENPAMLCSILLLDETGNHLLRGAAPSLPDFYTDAINGVEIGEGVGSCGAAAFTNKRVIVDDIQNHPYWEPYKELAEQAGLGACWSEPIRSSQGEVLGTFAIYHQEAKQPTATHIKLIEQITSLTSVAIEKKQAHLALEASDEQMQLVLSGAELGFWDWNLVTGKVIRNKRWAVMLGYTHEEIKSTTNQWGDFIHQDDKDKAWKSINDVIEGRSNYHSLEYRMLTKEGGYRWIHDQASVVQYDENGKSLRMSGTHNDITERKQAEEKLKLAASVFTYAREGIVITDNTATIIDVNHAFTSMTGFSREEVIGKTPRILKSGLQPPKFYTAMWKSLLKDGHWFGELWSRRKNGEVYAEMKTISAVLDEKGNTTHYVSLGNDITSMKEHQEQLERIAHYDPLTHLPNRSLFSDRLSKAMLQCSRNKHSLAVAFLDLDGFKVINDAYGHDMGDKLLIALSVRIKKALREGDSLARFGGDEFVFILANLDKAEDCEPVLERLLLAASEPVTVNDVIFHVSASIGVTFYPQDNIDAEQLIRHADQAMYIAKESGKNQYHLFDTTQDDAVKAQRQSLEEIRYALDSKQFVLYYQPKVNMRTGKVTGVEALIRWQHPERGLLNPAVFLPVIENSPMSIEVGEWVIDTALTQINQWQQMGLKLPVRTSVNIAAMQLQQPNFTQKLTTLLAAHPDVEARYLELEVLETSALEDVSHISTIMNDCMALGVSFALDDFGTGYSSLTYLRRLPARLIKIDQSFVRDMLIDPDDFTIVEGVIALAKSFKRDVIAEGVETVEHGKALLQLGCELAQGYGIARPMPANDIPGWITDWKPDVSWKT